MRTFPFEYSDELKMIVLTARIDGYQVNLALDTGATNTVVDLTEILVAGYQMKDAVGSEEYETASGTVMAHSFAIRNFVALGESRQNFEVGAYDYLAAGVMTNIEGVLGLDFFADRVFCIDMAKKEISF